MKLSIKLLSLFLIIGTAAYAADTASILPPAKTTFFDQNGKPLTSGTVDFYIPSTTTRKATWQDAGETILNANPVVLDSAGRALILGSGSYRQIVKDRQGNTIWDQVTSSTGSGGSTPTLVGDGLAVGTVIQWAGITPPSQYVFSYGQEVSRVTFSAALTSITSTQAIFCTSGSPIITGLGDTTNFPIGASVELSCVAAGFSTIISKTSTTLTLAANANVTTNTNAVIFPWGRGNGTTTFNVPDYRGLVPVGNNNMGGVASSDLNITYYGANPNSIGQLGGSQSKTLVLTNLPPYTPSGAVGTISTTSTVATFVKNTGNIISSVVPSGGVAGLFGDVTAVSMGSVLATGPAPSFTGSAQGGLSTPLSAIPPAKTINFIFKLIPDTSISISGVVTSLGGMTGAITCGTGVTCSGNNISASNAAITTGTTIVTGGPGILQNSVNGGPLISSLTLLSGVTAPALIITGSLSAAGLVTNAALASPTITINSTSCTLGSSCTVGAGSITAGSTLVNGGPGILQNASNGGALVSSLNLPSGLIAPSFTVTGTIAGPLGTTGTFISSNNGSNTGFVVQYASSLTSIGNNFNAPLALLVNNTPQLTIAATTGNVTLAGKLIIPNISNGGIVYSNASTIDILAGTVTAGQCLLSGSSSAPTWGSCAGAVASVSSVTDSGAGTLTISPTTGSVIAAINLAHANTWTNTISGTTTAGTLNFNFQTTGATGTAIPATATMGKIFDGSAASPHTANTPTIGITRYDAINSATLSGNAPAIYAEVIANGTGAGNPNSASIIGITSQSGKGDVVGLVGNATQSSSTAGYVAYGVFSAVNAASVGSLAFGLETNSNNGTGVDIPYTNLSPFPSLVGVHVGSGGNLNTVAFWASNNGAQWDVGLAFTANAVKTAAIQDDSNSLTIIKATGTHTNGIDLSGATLTTAYKSNGFNVSGIGVLYTNAFGVGALYGAFGSGINSISGSNIGQYVLAIQNSHGSVGDSGLIVAAGSSTTTDASTNMITFFTSGLGAVVGAITRNGVSSVNYGTSSDERLKTNFNSTKRGINELLKIKVEDFTWKEDTTKTIVQGLVAQRLYEVYPEAVHIGGDDPTRNSWQVDYGRLSPLIIKSIQDLEARIRNLEERK